MGSSKKRQVRILFIPFGFEERQRDFKTLKEILQRCKDHLPDIEFGKCLYEKPATMTIYPKIRYYKGKFDSTVYEKDVGISPRTYLNVKCDVRALIRVEGILLGDRLVCC